MDAVMSPVSKVSALCKTGDKVNNCESPWLSIVVVVSVVGVVRSKRGTALRASAYMGLLPVAKPNGLINTDGAMSSTLVPMLSREIV